MDGIDGTDAALFINILLGTILLVYIHSFLQPMHEERCPFGLWLFHPLLDDCA